MSLCVTIRKNEIFFMNGQFIKNDSGKKMKVYVNEYTEFLRPSHIMAPDEANTPAKRIKFQIQNMYLFDQKGESEHKFLSQLMKDYVMAAPFSGFIMYEISELVIEGNFFKALKKAHELVKFEKEYFPEIKYSVK